MQVSGGAFYEVDAFLTYRITDPRLFRERALGELAVAEDRIATRFDAALRQVYGLREFNAALSEQRAADDARSPRPDPCRTWPNSGIEVVDVRILRTDLDAGRFEQTFDRMKAERLAEAALLRARGQEAAQTLTRHRRPSGGRDRRGGHAATRKSSAARAMPSATAIFAAAYRAGPGVLRVLPLDAVLPHGAGRYRHDDGAVARLASSSATSVGSAGGETPAPARRAASRRCRRATLTRAGDAAPTPVDDRRCRMTPLAIGRRRAGRAASRRRPRPRRRRRRQSRRRRLQLSSEPAPAQ